jgi:hypothetical protein
VAWGLDFQTLFPPFLLSENCRFLSFSFLFYFPFLVGKLEDVNSEVVFQVSLDEVL